VGRLRILLVRHGQSEANVNKSILLEKPDHAISLSEDGFQQARDAGKAICDWSNSQRQPPRFRIWYSPYLRTEQTANEIAKSLGYDRDAGEVSLGRRMSMSPKFPRVRDMREHVALVEQQFGLFDGIADEDLPKRFPAEYAFYKKHEDFEGRFWARMPLGESRLDVTLRVHQAFGTFHRDAERHSIEDLIIVAHGVVIRAFVMAWCHKNVAWFEKEKNPANCSVRLIGGGEDQGYIYPGVRNPHP